MDPNPLPKGRKVKRELAVSYLNHSLNTVVGPEVFSPVLRLSMINKWLKNMEYSGYYWLQLICKSSAGGRKLQIILPSDHFDIGESFPPLMHLNFWGMMWNRGPSNSSFVYSQKLSGCLKEYENQFLSYYCQTNFTSPLASRGICHRQEAQTQPHGYRTSSHFRGRKRALSSCSVFSTALFHLNHHSLPNGLCQE